MLIEEVQNSDTPLRYHVVENQELYLDLNDIGEVDKVYRYYWTDAENIITRYGKKAMSKKFLEKYNKWEEARDGGAAVAPIDVKILHAVELRRTGKSNPEETVANKKWASFIIDIEHKHIIKESGYDEFPYAVFYWEHNGKPYGLSPTISGMRDIQYYQEYYSAYNIAVQNIINPPMVQTPGITHWDYSPGGHTVVPNMQQVPQPIVKENLGSLLSQKAEFEQRVKEWFYVDFCIMLRQREGLGEMTATAVAAMQGEQVALLSSIVANFYQELDRIVERTFNILAKRGMLPPMPLPLQRLGGALKIHHIGILAQAQQKLYESGGVADYMGLVAQFAELAKIDPEFAKAIGWVDPHSVFRGVMAARDIPSNFLKTPDEYKAWVEATDQKAAAMAEREAAAMENQALLQNAKTLSQKPAPGSPLEHLFTPKGNTFLN
jgi:hypothetical protein